MGSQNNCEQSLQDAFFLCRRCIHLVIKQELHSQVWRRSLVFAFVLETGPEAVADLEPGALADWSSLLSYETSCFVP